MASMQFPKVLEDRGLSHTGWVLLYMLDGEDDLTQGQMAPIFRGLPKADEIVVRRFLTTVIERLSVNQAASATTS